MLSSGVLLYCDISLKEMYQVHCALLAVQQRLFILDYVAVYLLHWYVGHILDGCTHCYSLSILHFCSIRHQKRWLEKTNTVFKCNNRDQHGIRSFELWSLYKPWMNSMIMHLLICTKLLYWMNFKTINWVFLPTEQTVP